MKSLLERLFGSRPPCNCGKKMYAIRRNVPIFVCVCGMLKVGKNTISMSPAGSNVMRWSATQAALAAGDLGMDVATGEPQAFVGGSSKAILTTASLQQSLFTFTHTSGASSTGALGFTPRFAIYTGAVQVSSVEISIATGFATGTAGNARANCFGFNQGSGSPIDPGGTAATELSGIGGHAQTIQGTPTYSTGFSRVLDVTAFSSAGITLTWSLAVTSHQGSLLVVG